MDEPGVCRGGNSGKPGVEGGQGCKERKPVREACFHPPGNTVFGAEGLW